MNSESESLFGWVGHGGPIMRDGCTVARDVQYAEGKRMVTVSIIEMFSYLCMLLLPAAPTSRNHWRPCSEEN